MAHYAFIDENNFVVQIITGVDEEVVQFDGGVEIGGSSEAWEQFYQNQSWYQGLICKRTSYNNNYRKQYAEVGGTYDVNADVFVKSKPYPSWTLDSNHDWQPPTPRPEGNYYWKETELAWIEVVNP